MDEGYNFINIVIQSSQTGILSYSYEYFVFVLNLLCSFDHFRPNYKFLLLKDGCILLHTQNMKN